MDLPPEIRNKVYANLLCSFGEQKEKTEAEGKHEGATEIKPVGQLAQKAILLVNQQIHEEAKDVMLKQNQFVCIFTRGVRILTLPVQVMMHTNTPVQDSIVKDFKGAVISYHIDSLHNEGPRSCCFNDPPYDFIILARDLDAFLRAFVGPDDDLPQLPLGTEHRIVMHSPFEALTDNKDHDLAKVQKTLLQPFQEHLHDFSHVSIKGTVDNKVAKSTLRAIADVSLPNPNTLIEVLTNLKNKGCDLFREEKTHEAKRTWHVAIFKLRRLQDSDLWEKMEEEFDRDIFGSLAQLYFTLCSNTAQYHLRETHAHSADGASEKVLVEFDSLNVNIQYALMAAGGFGSNWRLSFCLGSGKDRVQTRTGSSAGWRSTRCARIDHACCESPAE